MTLDIYTVTSCRAFVQKGKGSYDLKHVTLGSPVDTKELP